MHWGEHFNGLRFWSGRGGIVSFRAGQYGDGSVALQLMTEDGEVDRVLTVRIDGADLEPGQLLVRWNGTGGLLEDTYPAGALHGALVKLGLFKGPLRLVDAGFVEAYAAVMALAQCPRPRDKGHELGYAVACAGCRAPIEERVEEAIKQRLARESVKMLEKMAKER